MVFWNSQLFNTFSRETHKQKITKKSKLLKETKKIGNTNELTSQTWALKGARYEANSTELLFWINNTCSSIFIPLNLSGAYL